MNYCMRESIDSLASDILNAINITPPIDDISKVVKKLGGELVENSKLNFTNDGQLNRQSDGDGFLITVPSFQSRERKNFTVAHELGHLFLHMGYIIDDDLWKKTKNETFFRGGDSILEQQANEFAAAFLMPKNKYKELIDTYCNGDQVYIGKVADYFHVSIDAAAYRGKWLGYLKW